jgi:hypothetical protein
VKCELQSKEENCFELRPEKSLELIFISDNFREFVSKFNSSINRTDLSFRNVKTKEYSFTLGLKTVLKCPSEVPMVDISSGLRVEELLGVL